MLGQVKIIIITLINSLLIYIKSSNKLLFHHITVGAWNITHFLFLSHNWLQISSRELASSIYLRHEHSGGLGQKGGVECGEITR